MLARTALHARNLRKEPAAAEQRLWQALRGEAMDGLKFRRQHPIDRYVADFACVSLKLVIEVDGGVHQDDAQALYDLTRSEVIEALGWRVTRFANAQSCNDIDGVLAEIRKAAALTRGA